MEILTHLNVNFYVLTDILAHLLQECALNFVQILLSQTPQPEYAFLIAQLTPFFMLTQEQTNA